MRCALALGRISPEVLFFPPHSHHAICSHSKQLCDAPLPENRFPRQVVEAGGRSTAEEVALKLGMAIDECRATLFAATPLCAGYRMSSFRNDWWNSVCSEDPTGRRSVSVYALSAGSRRDSGSEQAPLVFAFPADATRRLRAHSLAQRGLAWARGGAQVAGAAFRVVFGASLIVGFVVVATAVVVIFLVTLNPKP